MCKFMKFKKNSSPRTIVFLVFYCWINFVYTIEPSLACFSSQEFFVAFGESAVEQLSLNTNEDHEDFHHCHCKQCKVHNARETIIQGTYTNKQEKQQNVAHNENISGLKITPSNGIIHSTSSPDSSKLHSLFLLKSTFLL